jgi:FkbM family methyltransferase
MKTVIKDIIRKTLAQLGWELVRKQPPAPPPVTLSIERLRRVKALGFEPQVIFDCGAYLGSWTREVSRIWPAATFVMMEPNQDVVGQARENLKAAGVKGVLLDVAVGESCQSGVLNLWYGENSQSKDIIGQASSLLSHVQPSARQMPVQVRSLDSICAELKLMPDFVKLDLQGGELAALKGASTLFGRTELFMIEFGCLDAYIGRTTPAELIAMMDRNNYSLYDIVDLLYRPGDRALSSGDFFFVRKDSKLKGRKGYS